VTSYAFDDSSLDGRMGIRASEMQGRRYHAVRVDALAWSIFSPASLHCIGKLDIPISLVVGINDGTLTICASSDIPCEILVARNIGVLVVRGCDLCL